MERLKVFNNQPGICKRFLIYVTETKKIEQI